MVKILQDSDKVEGVAPVAAADAAAPALNQQAAPTTDNAAASQDTAAAQQPAQHMSKGEKAFDTLVYNVMNYWINLGLSLWIADKFTHGSWRKPLDFAIGKIAKGVSKTGAATLESAHHQTRVALETVVLTSGGTIMAIPVKWAEDAKRPIVHWLNKMMGVEQKGADGHDLSADEIYIENKQPHHGWMNIVKRRLLGMGTVMLTGMAIDHVGMDKSQPKSSSYKLNPYDPNSQTITRDAGFKGGKDVVTEWVMKWVNKGMTAMGRSPIVKDSTVDRYASMAILDSVFTKITAVIMKKTNGAKTDAPDCKEPPCPPAQQELQQQQPAAPSVPAAPETAVPEAAVLASRSDMEERGAVPMVIPDTAPRRGTIESFKKSEIAPRSIHPSAVNDALDSGLAMAP